MYAKSTTRPEQPSNSHHSIINHQACDIQLQEQVQNDHNHYTHEEIHTFEVIVYIPNPTHLQI